MSSINIKAISTKTESSGSIEPEDSVLIEIALIFIEDIKKGDSGGNTGGSRNIGG